MENKAKISMFIKFLLLIIVCTFLLLRSDLMFSGIVSGVDVSLNVLLPSLYGFMIFSSLVLSTSMQTVISYPFSYFAKKLFKLEPSLFCIYILSLLGGYPIGAKLLSEKLESGDISKGTAEYMLCFCTNCSPAFLITGVGIALWGKVWLGVLLYASQILSSLVIGLFMGALEKHVHKQAQDSHQIKMYFSVALVNAVNSSSKAMAVICSFVIAFFAFFPFLDLLPIKGDLLFVLKGFLEVSFGCYEIQNHNFTNEIILICAFTAFGGICVIMQIMALLQKSQVSFKGFLLSRVANTIISCIFCFVLLKFFPQTVDVFASHEHFIVHGYSTSPIASIFMLFLGLLLLSFSRKYDKI